jgi:hypothetical protein
MRIRSLKWLLLLLFGGVAGHASIAAAQPLGTFTPTGEMVMSRALHSATLMANGQVLIAGGMSNPPDNFQSTVLGGAEVYDPVTATFRPVGPMTVPRRLHTATLLPDDTVLIVGGDNRGALASAEIFDPATESFHAVGRLSTPRMGHTAILLPTGTVLIIGGYGSGVAAYPNLAPAELYDPVSGTFSPAGEYVGRGGCDFCPPSVLMADGTVLFPGQEPAQVYEPASNSFSPGGMMSFELSAAVTLLNGQVLFAGGEDCCGRSSGAELYTPAAHTFAATGKLTIPRVWHTLTLLPDGTVLATGGETDACGTTSSGSFCMFAGSVASAEIFDPTTAKFVPTDTMGVAREEHTATLLNDGRVLVAGGTSYGGIGVFGGTIGTAELYAPDVLTPAPVLVSISGDGRGQGAIFHAGTQHVAAPEDPAEPEEVVDISCTGLPVGGAIPPQVAIGGRMATVLEVTTMPGIAGATQIRVRVPTGITAGAAVPVRLTYLARPSNEVTIAVAN